MIGEMKNTTAFRHCNIYRGIAKLLDTSDLGMDG